MSSRSDVEGSAAAAQAVPGAEEGATVLALAAGFAILLGAALLYHRLRGTRILEQGTRQRVHEIVRETPGLTFNELHERVGVPRQTLQHHVRVLEREGLLLVARINGRGLHYTPGAWAPGENRVKAVLDKGSATFARVLSVIESRPGITPAEVRKTTGLSSAHLAYYINRFEAQGYVRRERQGARVALHPVRSEGKGLSSPSPDGAA